MLILVESRFPDIAISKYPYKVRLTPLYTINGFNIRRSEVGLSDKALYFRSKASFFIRFLINF